MMCAFLQLSATRPDRDGDIRLSWPVALPGERAPAPFIIDTADIDLARAAVAVGARAVLVRTVDDLDPVDRMAVALAVIEAECGLEAGSVGIIAVAAGAGAVLALSRDVGPRPRLVALGLDEAALPAAEAPTDNAMLVTARGLIALAAAARALPAVLVGPATVPPDTA